MDARGRNTLRLPEGAPPRAQQGISLVLMALSVVMLFGFAMLAIDTSNLYVARNELQNAADGGALAGARWLYLDDGSAVNPDANQVAADTAASNDSQGEPVEVTRVRRGHWSFGTRTFTPNPSLEPVELFGKTAAELDADPNFINAVEVVTERNATPVAAFFGYIFGHSEYQSAARAVAYIGYAGDLRPFDVDQPIALCEEKLLQPDGSYDCSIGRFISSSSNDSYSETGGWTSFNQDDACQGGTNTDEMRSLVCGNGNPESLTLGKDMATLGGQSQATFNDFEACWATGTGETELWNMTLPVIQCNGDNPGPCNQLVGAVNVNVAWVVDQANNIDRDAPTQMELPDWNADGQSDGTWSNDDPDGRVRWDDFVETFNIRRPDGEIARWDPDPQVSGWQKKTIYFLPDCSPHEPTGNTGGENFGVLAEIPVLVQ